MVQTRRQFGRAVLSVVTIGAFAGCGGDSDENVEEPTSTETSTAHADGSNSGSVDIISRSLTLEDGTAAVTLTVQNTTTDTVYPTVEISLTVDGGESYSDSSAIGIQSGSTVSVDFSFDVMDAATEADIEYQTTVE